VPLFLPTLGDASAAIRCCSQRSDMKQPGSILLLLFHLDPQIAELEIGHRGRCIHHQIFGGCCFGERNHLAQTVSASKDHHDAIEPKRNAAVRGRAILQSLQKKSEARPGFFLGHAERVKDLPLNILAVNTNRA